MFCIHCGTELPDNAKFCFSCGKQITVTDTSMTDENAEVLQESVDSNVENNKFASMSQIDEQLEMADNIGYFKSNPKEREALQEIIYSDEKIISIGNASTKINDDNVVGVLVLTNKNAIFIRRSRFLEDITLRLRFDVDKKHKYDKGFFSSDVYIDGLKFNIDSSTFNTMQSVFDNIQKDTFASKEELSNVMSRIDNADTRKYFEHNPQEKNALANIISESENIEFIVQATLTEDYSSSPCGALVFTDKRAIFLCRNSLLKDATTIIDLPQKIYYKKSFLSIDLIVGRTIFSLDKDSFEQIKQALEKYNPISY